MADRKSAKDWLREHGVTDATIVASEAELDQAQATVRNIVPLAQAMAHARRHSDWGALATLFRRYQEPLTPEQLRDVLSLVTMQMADLVLEIDMRGLRHLFAGRH